VTIDRTSERHAGGTRTGSVVRIHEAPVTGGDPKPRASVEAVAGRGLGGGRYYRDEGVYNEREDLEPGDLTPVELEALEAAGGLRRGVRARRTPSERDDARGHARPPRGGTAPGRECRRRGIGPCGPCGYVESLAGRTDAATGLEGRGGLDARIVGSGRIGVGDDVVW
jgi:hypothetical protein